MKLRERLIYNPTRRSTVAIIIAISAIAISQVNAERLFRDASPAVVTITCGQVTGSGFLVRDQRTIVTSEHVIDACDVPTIKLSNGETRRTIALASSKIKDLAVLSLDRPVSAKPLVLADREPLNPGAKVYAIGSALGTLTNTITDGLFSRLTTIEGVSFVQVTAPISPGMSGGPVLNNLGKVVGVITGSITDGQNLNLAVSAKHVRELLSAQVINVEARPGSGLNEYIPNIRWKAHEKSITSVSISPDSKRIVSSSVDGTVKVWNSANKRQVFSLDSHQGFVWDSVYTADGKFIVTSSMDKSVRIWDSNNGSRLRTLLGHSSPVTSAVFILGKRQVLTGCEDGTIRLFDYASGALLKQVRGVGSAVNSIALAPNELSYAVATADKTVSVFDVESHLVSAFLTGHSAAVTEVRYVLGGRQLLTSSEDLTARLWDAKSHSVIAKVGDEQGYSYSPRYHTEAVLSADIRADGKRIVTASRDRKIRVWNVSEGRELLYDIGTAGYVGALSSAANGAWFVYGNIDGELGMEEFK